MSNGSTRPIDRTQSGAIIPGQSGPCNDGNEGVLCIPYNFSIIGALDCFMSYQWHSLQGSYSAADMQSVYSIVSANLADKFRRLAYLNRLQNRQ